MSWIVKQVRQHARCNIKNCRAFIVWVQYENSSLVAKILIQNKISWRLKTYIWNVFALWTWNKTGKICIMYHWSAFTQLQLQWKSNKYCIFWVCVCNLSNTHAPYCHLWPVRLYSIFPPYLIYGMIFEEKLLSIKYVFWFSLQHLFVIFLILRRTEWDMFRNV
jgi:hypothetical protein